METEFWRIDYISYEGNARWMTIEVLVGITEEQIEEYSNGYSGMGDELCDFVSTEPCGFDGYSEDWTHIELY